MHPKDRVLTLFGKFFFQAVKQSAQICEDFDKFQPCGLLWQ